MGYEQYILTYSPPEVESTVFLLNYKNRAPASRIHFRAIFCHTFPAEGGKKFTFIMISQLEIIGKPFQTPETFPPIFSEKYFF